MILHILTSSYAIFLQALSGPEAYLHTYLPIVFDPPHCGFSVTQRFRQRPFGVLNYDIKLPCICLISG